MNLNVNIDHIATLRQARRENEPDLILGAKEVIKAGADGLTFHLREDRRHIQDKDIYRIKSEIQSNLNFECALYQEIVEIVLEIIPHEVTIVPEKRQEITTEGGLDVIGTKDILLKTIPKFQSKNILVSLFINADKNQIKVAKDIGANAIEIHTGKYAHLNNPADKQKELELIREMVYYGKELGLIVNAGHGLNYENTLAIATIKEINELNIGHSIISRSIFVGIYQAVKEMLEIVKG